MKKFTVTFTEDEYNKTIECKSTNQGFSAFEIIGLLEMKKEDLREQLTNEPKFKRYLINPDGTRQEVVKESEDTE